jgi:hypothetical protein
MSTHFAVDPPSQRKLRIFSFDPSLATQYDFADMSRVTASIRWEKLGPGPTGEYIEVVDVDPASGMVYHPVDLNDPFVLATDGLNPSESVPQFHQQMVYAVAMTTINHFERALGRVALWSARWNKKETRPGDPNEYESEFVRRLRIYPHALRDRNAFYSPDKKAILFGYFPVSRKDKHNTPGTLVFTCLSHDIVAHEVTHALLDGVHPRFNEPTNPDVHAFHEAFADVVALFQHFTYPGVLKAEIGRARGDMSSDSLLGKLAQQFGLASGRGGALRDALGGVNAKTGRWEPQPPDPRALEGVTEAHDRGAILVAAIFGAYTKIYRNRTSDLFRIATDGTGVLKDGALHPDLVGRLAGEAEKSARHVLQMCIRAIDYCPPVDITFGDYLRALVTADFEYDQDDERDYRTAFIESFREWGIHPRNMRSMSAESLLWPSGAEIFPDLELRKALKKVLGRMTRDLTDWNLESDREYVAERMDDNARKLWNFFVNNPGITQQHQEDLLKGVGLASHLQKSVPATVYRSPKAGFDPPPDAPLATEIHSVRTTLRRTLRGNMSTDLVVEVTQRRAGFLDKADQRAADRGGTRWTSGNRSLKKKDFTFRRGCTLIIDVNNGVLRRIISTVGDVTNETELDHMRRYLTSDAMEPPNAFARAVTSFASREPFALLHGHGEN